MRVRFSEDAKRDILEQCEWYEHRESAALALRWMDQIDATIRRIVRNPRAGAVCFPIP